MLITIPKMTVDNKFKMTTVINPATTFTGFEPTTIRMNGQTFEGTKVYTVDKGSFKMFCSPEAFGQAMQHVLTAQTPATVEALALPSASSKLSPVKAKAKLLTA